MSQGVGVATGIQDKFSWNAVGLAAIGGGVGAAVGGGAAAASWQQAATRAVTANIITQGIGVATGLQDKFSWAGVAASAVGGAIGHAVGKAVHATSLYNTPTAANLGANLVKSGAQIVADAATRSLIDGTDFGDNVIAALPTALGSLVGEALVGGISGRGASTTGSPSSGKIRQTSKQYQDERVGTNLYGIPEGFEDKVQPGPPLEEVIVVTGTRRARAPEGWWRGIDFTPEQEHAPAASGYYTPQPSAWMQNIQALGSQPQRLPSYNEVLALENARGYAWEAGPTPFERWEQHQTELGMAYLANSMTGSGAVASLGSRAAGGSLEDQVAWGQLFGVLEGAAGGMVGTPAFSRGRYSVSPYAIEYDMASVNGLARTPSRAVTLRETGFESGRFQLRDNMRPSEYAGHYRSVRANGVQNPLIEYIVIGDTPYILRGNNRFAAAEQTGRLDELRFRHVELPLAGTNFNTVEDVLNVGYVPRPTYRDYRRGN